MIRLGIVGCGDVAFRTYFPGLKPLLDNGEVQVAVCFDPISERAERAAALFPGAKAATSLDEAVAFPDLTAALNLTPAPFHRDTTAAMLAGGLNVFSEKPLAATVEDGQKLIAYAASVQRTLMCAPAILVTNRFRWISGLVRDGEIGQPKLAVAQMANMGPAAWRDYTGDPRVFYGPGVGPMIDTGVYVLHAITGAAGSGEAGPGDGRDRYPAANDPNRPVSGRGDHGRHKRSDADPARLWRRDVRSGGLQLRDPRLSRPSVRAPRNRR